MSSFGRLFKITTFGESHSYAVGGVIENFPANFKVPLDYIQMLADRRRPGQSSITTPRKETDQVQILSGLENGVSLGTPIGFLILNQNTIKTDYSTFDDIPRPGHADYTYLEKYGIKTESGGGRSSARETASRVVAGAFADIYLQQKEKIQIMGWISSIGDIQIPTDFNDKLIHSNSSEFDRFTLDAMGTFLVHILEEKNEKIFKNKFSNKFYDKEANDITLKIIEKDQNLIFNDEIYKIHEEIIVRCPHEQTAIKMIGLIEKTKVEKDSIGGCVTAVIKNPPVGLGEPCFDKIEALLAHAMLSIPATKGFDIGKGFECMKMKGSSHNDVFFKNEDNNKLKTLTNNAGGILGGITNGENIYFRVAFKPVSTIGLPQKTVNFLGDPKILEAKGRHDPCVLPRAVPIVESMAAIVVMDCYLIQKAIDQKQ